MTALSVRPIHAGDLAQAWLFDDILQNEIAELQEAADTIRALASHERDQSHRNELRRLRAHIKEVRRLLKALRRRFPPADHAATCANMRGETAAITGAAGQQDH